MELFELSKRVGFVTFIAHVAQVSISFGQLVHILGHSIGRNTVDTLSPNRLYLIQVQNLKPKVEENLISKFFE